MSENPCQEFKTGQDQVANDADGGDAGGRLFEMIGLFYISHKNENLLKIIVVMHMLSGKKV